MSNPGDTAWLLVSAGLVMLMTPGLALFYGGMVVHLTSGISALVVALMLGKRKGDPTVRHPPHDLTMTIVGAGLLWFGWFGFNGGSAAHVDGTAALALFNTHLAAAAGALTWT